MVAGTQDDSYLREDRLTQTVQIARGKTGAWLVLQIYFQAGSAAVPARWRRRVHPDGEDRRDDGRDLDGRRPRPGGVRKRAVTETGDGIRARLFLRRIETYPAAWRGHAC